MSGWFSHLYKFNTRGIGFFGALSGLVGSVYSYVNTTAAHVGVVNPLGARVSGIVTLIGLVGAVLGRNPAIPDDPGAVVLNPTSTPPAGPVAKT